MTLLAPALDGAEKQGFIDANGHSLAWEQFGCADAPAMVLIAGLGAQLVAWPDAFCQALANSGLRVIRFDHRDVGLSSKLDAAPVGDRPRQATLKYMLRRPIDAPYTLADMAHDVLGLLDALGIRQAHVVGMSMGAMIAQLLAVQQPQRVLSLTSMMASTGARRLSWRQLRLLQRVATRPDRVDEDTVVAHRARSMQALGGAEGYSEGAWADAMRTAFRRSYYPPGAARQLLAVLAAPARTELLRTLRQPALVVHGAADPLWSRKHGRDTAVCLPQARYEEIAGMGHCLPPRWLSELVDMIVAVTRPSLDAG